ncbi:MAG: SPASM domain-containing protein, partial [Negativicutes bacterium]|nr:SPASM domain-containing protein [Negativicutes bacterium]
DVYKRQSHARVLDNIRRIVGIYHGENYYLRGTFTALNPDFAADVEYLLDQGFDRLSFEPVVTTIPGLALTGQHLPILDQQYRRLTDLYVRRHLGGRPFDYFHFNLDFAASQCEEKLAGGCGAGSQYLAVAADGDIYPCHQFAGGRTHRLGGLESGVTNWPLVEQLSRCHIFSGQDCRGCWARFFCGGGCAANNWSQTGNFTGQWRLGCDLLRQRCEWAIVVRAKIKLGAGEEGDGHDQDKMDE